MSAEPEEPSSGLPLDTMLYDELRAAARSAMRNERRLDHTLQATALVHEAFVRMRDHEDLKNVPKRNLMRIAGTVMRRVLVDHARRKHAEKRGKDWGRITLDEQLLPASESIDVLTLHEALTALEAEEPRAAKVVEHRFFGGCTMTEIAELLGISERTAHGDWSYARAWLRRRMEG
ncbi:MAG: sigma-70 family RNA polymerase sigma factor [Planctomycetes bacterium]|nr:sigma-70 family RNA polymerase sigma factor [Planctomycetota bacterium]